MKLSMSFGRLALAGMQWSLPDVLFSALRVTACPPPLSVLGRARPFHGIWKCLLNDIFGILHALKKST